MKKAKNIGSAGERREPLPRAGLALPPLFCAGFAIYGMYCNGFGANADATMAYFGIDEVKNGAIMTAQSFGCLAVAVAMGLFGERLNKLYALSGGLALLGAAGVLIGLMPELLGFASYPLMLGYSLIAGLGYISIDLLTNSAIADVFGAGKNRVLPYVHAFYGGGAMLAPVFVAAFVSVDRPESFARPYLLIGSASLVCAAALAAAGRKLRQETPYADMSEIRARARRNPAEIFKEGSAWLFLLSGFMNLSFQTGLTTWLPRYCGLVWGYDATSAALMVTAFFTGALIMRLATPLAYAKVGVRRFYQLSLLVSAAVYLVFLLAPLPDVLRTLLAGLIGLLQGATVPTLVILCCDAFPQRSASASSIIVFGVSLASMLSPVVLGKLLTVDPEAAMLGMSFCIVVAALALPGKARAAAQR